MSLCICWCLGSVRVGTCSQRTMPMIFLYQISVSLAEMWTHSFGPTQASVRSAVFPSPRVQTLYQQNRPPA